MWKDNHIFLEDLEQLSLTEIIPWHELEDKTIFITGGTGLIGYTVASALIYFSLKNEKKIKVVLLVRDIEKAKEQYSKQLLVGADIEFIEGTVEHLPQINIPIDYVFHGAAPTGSSYFINQPVDTINTVCFGSNNILSFCREKKVTGMVYLSSMEVYGAIYEKTPLSEDKLGEIDILSPRSSYSEGKRMAENMCVAYYSQYQVPVTMARLAQTFGPGVKTDDQRVFAYMVRSALQNNDIELATDGTKENMYLYTADAVAALLLLMVKGNRGEAYNIANEKTYCSIKVLGETVLTALDKTNLKVKTNMGGSNAQFRPNGYLNLDVKNLKKLGWNAQYDLPEMLQRMGATFGI